MTPATLPTLAALSGALTGYFLAWLVSRPSLLNALAAVASFSWMLQILQSPGVSQ